MRMAAILATAAGLLAACAHPVVWEKTGASDERRATDLAECSSLARNEMRSHRMSARESASEPDKATIGRNEDAAVLRRLGEADAAERRAELIADCMRAKGYAAASAKGRDA